MATPRKHMAGFSLTELIVVLLVVAVIAGIGAPSFQYVTTSNRIAAEINGLVGDLEFARSEAIKQGEPVTVCASVNGTNCTGGSRWERGWIVVLAGTGPTSQRIVRSQAAFTPVGDTLQPTLGNLSSVTFNRVGYGSTGSTTPVTLALHDSTSNVQWTRCLAISPVGMLTVENTNQPGCT